MVSANQKNSLEKENVVAGIVGAFLFSLVGGLAWFLFHLIGFVASFSGLIGVVMAIKGYKLFAKKESIKGVIIAAVIAFLVLVLAWYLCLGKEIYDAYQTWYKNGDVDFTLTYPESVRAIPLFLEEPEIRSDAIKQLLLGLGFAIFGAAGTIFTTIRSIRMRNAAANSKAELPDETNELAEQEPAVAIRSAVTDEKTREFLKATAFGHEIVFRKVIRKREELVIDGMVYAEKEIAGVQFPYEMHVWFDGHLFAVGYAAGIGNFISADNEILCKKIRW